MQTENQTTNVFKGDVDCPGSHAGSGAQPGIPELLLMVSERAALPGEVTGNSEGPKPLMQRRRDRRGSGGKEITGLSLRSFAFLCASALRFFSSDFGLRASDF